MTTHLTDSELWSGLDRNARSVSEHVAQCPVCRERADAFRAGIDAVAAASTLQTPPLPASVGPYLVHRRLGEGGMGIVYEAEQQAPRRLVAIKVVRGGLHVDDYRLKLFEREAQTLARLKHPAIAAVYEGGRTPEGEHFFAMELVHGVPLTDYVRERNLPRRRRLELFEKVCRAINYAHQRGVIHRDLKPSNILVDAEGQPKILDFGLARITDSEGSPATATFEVGRIIGTLPYMSPEEVRGDLDAVDVRSDVYSLGVIMYELLTDQLPYTVRRQALPEAIRLICEEPPTPAGVIDRTLRGDLDTIVAKALEKDVTFRYQSAAAMAEDIERYLHDQPVLARRGNAFYLFRKLLMRHRLACIILVGLLAVFVITSAAVTSITASSRARLELNIAWQDLMVANLEYRLAASNNEHGKPLEAEPLYRSALQKFLRLGRDGRAASTMLSLASILVARPQLSENDMHEAEGFLLEAVNAFRRLGSVGRDDLRRALLLLQTLYSVDYLDDPEGLDRVNGQLQALERGEPVADISVSSSSAPLSQPTRFANWLALSRAVQWLRT